MLKIEWLDKVIRNKFIYFSGFLDSVLRFRIVEDQDMIKTGLNI